MRNYIIAGNWKMNAPDISAFADNLAPAHDRVTRVVCPPYPYIREAVQAFAYKRVFIGAQNVSERENGAFTGDISAAMLAELGAAYVIIGHSERRQHHNETDELAANKIKTALSHGLTPIYCVGETDIERENNMTREIVTRQLRFITETADTARIIVAYEPVWAIGTGKNASPQDADEVCALIKTLTGGSLVLYGGSMSPENAEPLLRCAHIDGGLVGGASLDVQKFNAITAIAERCAEI